MRARMTLVRSLSATFRLCPRRLETGQSVFGNEVFTWRRPTSRPTLIRFEPRPTKNRENSDSVCDERLERFHLPGYFRKLAQAGNKMGVGADRRAICTRPTDCPDGSVLHDLGPSPLGTPSICGRDARCPPSFFPIFRGYWHWIRDFGFRAAGTNGTRRGLKFNLIFRLCSLPKTDTTVTGVELHKKHSYWVGPNRIFRVYRTYWNLIFT